MQHNIYIYILVMFAVTYLIRVLPLTLIRREIKNKTIRSFLYYVPYVTLAVMTFPAIMEATNSPLAGLAALVVGIILPGVDAASSRLRCCPCRGSVRAGIIFVMWLYFRIMKADSDNLSSASDC